MQQETGMRQLYNTRWSPAQEGRWRKNASLRTPPDMGGSVGLRSRLPSRARLYALLPTKTSLL